MAASEVTRHTEDLKKLINTIYLSPQGVDYVLESSFGKISKNKKRPTGDALEALMKEPLSEGTESLQELMVTALMELCKAKPTKLDAVEWLGQWLLTNNPVQPKVDDPDE